MQLNCFLDKHTITDKGQNIEHVSTVLQTSIICSDVSSCFMCHSTLEHPNTHGSAIAMEHQGHEDSPLEVKAVGPHPDKLKEVDYYELVFSAHMHSSRRRKTE